MNNLSLKSFLKLHAFITAVPPSLFDFTFLSITKSDNKIKKKKKELITMTYLLLKIVIK